MYSVQVADLVDGHSVATGNGSQCFAILDFMILGTLAVLGGSVADGYGTALAQVFAGFVSITSWPAVASLGGW